jgi:hypothetical protein
MCKHEENNVELQINIEKSPIPIVWLDTSIITTIAEFKFGYNLDKKASQRIVKLYTLISKLADEGKILCPHAEQSEEVWCHRKDWLNAINELSLGIETEAPQSIYLKQKKKFIQSFLNSEKAVSLSYRDAFLDDPINTLNEKLESQYFVYVDSKTVLGGSEKRKTVNNDIFRGWENLRMRNIKNNISFDRQLERELQGELIDRDQQIDQWDQLRGKPEGLEGLVEFYKSNYYRSIPYIYLQCTLTAHLLTRKEPIKSGDCMDIEHISTMLPYSNIFITDNPMKDLLLRRNLGVKYRTEVFSIKDIDDIIASLLNITQTG